jgi:ABC-type transport system involved in Fe-S cluster assembly fused permease/ATPase subunit
MDKVEILLAILVWLLVVGAALLRVPGGGVRSLIAPWLALTALTMVIEFIVLNLAWFGLLFFVGTEATAVGMVVSLVIFAITPVAWAIVLRRRAQSAAARNSAAAQNDAPAHV